MYPISSGMLSNRLLYNFGWSGDNAFSSADKDEIYKTVPISTDEANLLATTGTTRNNIQQNDVGMWMKAPTTEAEISNYLDKLYPKLSCCLNEREISVPILIKDPTDPNKTVTKYFSIKSNNSANECKIDGVNWYDDNSTPLGYNPKCEKLFVRLMAFLDKYDPNSPMINQYGGCTSNKHLKNNEIGIDFTSSPVLYELVDVNRKCLINECRQNSAYKRQQERDACNTVFCQSDITINDLDANSISILGTNVQQSCGVNSKLTKGLQGNESGSGSTSNTSGTTSGTSGTSGTTTGTSGTSGTSSTSSSNNDTNDTNNTKTDTTDTKTDTTDTTDTTNTTDTTTDTTGTSSNAWMMFGLIVIVLLIIFAMMSRRK